MSMDPSSSSRRRLYAPSHSSAESAEGRRKLKSKGLLDGGGTEVLAGELRAGEVLSAAGGRVMALLRLDRAMGAELTADGRLARVEVPDWIAPSLP